MPGARMEDKGGGFWLVSSGGIQSQQSGDTVIGE